MSEKRAGGSLKEAEAPMQKGWRLVEDKSLYDSARKSDLLRDIVTIKDAKVTSREFAALTTWGVYVPQLHTNFTQLILIFAVLGYLNVMILFCFLKGN